MLQSNKIIVKKEHILIFLIIIIAFSSRLIFLFSESLWPDEALYLFISENLSNNPLNLTDDSGEIFTKNPPLFMYILSLIFYFFDANTIVSSRLFVMLSDLCTIFIIYLIGKKLFGTTTGIIAACFTAINPLHVWISSRILIDILLTLFIYLSLYMLICNKKINFYFFSILGIFTKYNALPLLTIPVLVKINVKYFIYLYLFLFLSLLAFLSFGNINIFNNEIISYYSGFIQIPDLKQMFIEINFFLHPLIIILFIAGFAFVLKRKDFSAIFHWLLLFSIIRFFLPWIAFRISRYSLPLYPAILLYSAHGLIFSMETIKKKLQNKNLLINIIFISIFISICLIYLHRGYIVTAVNNDTFIGYKDAACFLNEQTKTKTLLTSSPRQMKFFAKNYIVYNLHENWSPEKVYEYVKEKNIHFLVIDKWSPHQPSWCLKYPFHNKGFKWRYNNKYVCIYEFPHE